MFGYIAILAQQLTTDLKKKGIEKHFQVVIRKKMRTVAVNKAPLNNAK